MGLGAICVVLILIGSTSFAQSDATGCGKTTFTNRHGHLYYEIWNSSGEICTWTFVPPQGRSNVMLLITIPHIARYSDDYWSDQIKLPDGTVLPHNTTSREYTDSTAAWCGVYIRAPDASRVTCPLDSDVTNVCGRAPRESETWPPRISSNSHYYYALISYAFIDCDVTEEQSTTAVASDDVISPTVPDTTTRTTNTPFIKPQDDAADDSNVLSLEDEVSKMRLSAIVVGVVSILFLLLIVVLVFLLKRSQKSTFDQPVAFRNANFSEDLSTEKLDRYHSFDGASSKA